MTTERPRFWCLHWRHCGYNGESLAELVRHWKDCDRAAREAAWEAFQAPRRRATRQWKARKKEVRHGV